MDSPALPTPARVPMLLDVEAELLSQWLHRADKCHQMGELLDKQGAGVVTKDEAFPRFRPLEAPGPRIGRPRLEASRPS